MPHLLLTGVGDSTWPWIYTYRRAIIVFVSKLFYVTLYTLNQNSIQIWQLKITLQSSIFTCLFIYYYYDYSYLDLYSFEVLDITFRNFSNYKMILQITAKACRVRQTKEQSALLCRYENYVFKELANYPLNGKMEPLLSPFTVSHAPFQTKRRRE